MYVGWDFPNSDKFLKLNYFTICTIFLVSFCPKDGEKYYQLFLEVILSYWMVKADG